jgi:hypothetical protein
MTCEGLTDGDDSAVFRMKAQLFDCLARERDLLLLVAQQRHEVTRLQTLVASLQLQQVMAPAGDRGACRYCGHDNAGEGSSDSGSSHGPLETSDAGGEADVMEGVEGVEAITVGMKRLRIEKVR